MIVGGRVEKKEQWGRGVRVEDGRAGYRQNGGERQDGAVMKGGGTGRWREPERGGGRRLELEESQGGEEWQGGRGRQDG
jgi:hypothetical protein